MRSTNSGFEWTDDTIPELRQLWSEGHSTAEIGRRMGMTKECRRRKGAPSGPAGTPIPDPHRQRAASAACTTPAACAEACAYRATLVLG
jgi:GcrA cell cycle regulator